MLIGRPAGLCGTLLSDSLIILFRAFKLSCFRDSNSFWALILGFQRAGWCFERASQEVDCEGDKKGEPSYQNNRGSGGEIVPKREPEPCYGKKHAEQ